MKKVSIVERGQDEWRWVFSDIDLHTELESNLTALHPWRIRACRSRLQKDRRLLAGGRSSPIQEHAASLVLPRRSARSWPRSSSCSHGDAPEGSRGSVHRCRKTRGGRKGSTR
jgi:hypothetical protein